MRTVNLRFYGFTNDIPLHFEEKYSGATQHFSSCFGTLTTFCSTEKIQFARDHELSFLPSLDAASGLSLNLVLTALSLLNAAMSEGVTQLSVPPATITSASP